MTMRPEDFLDLIDRVERYDLDDVSRALLAETKRLVVRMLHMQATLDAAAFERAARGA